MNANKTPRRTGRALEPEYAPPHLPAYAAEIGTCAFALVAGLHRVRPSATLDKAYDIDLL
jgi:hypothetical protein